MDRLTAVRDELRKFVAKRQWGQFHDPKNLAMAVASEAGELLSEYRWVSNEAADAWTSQLSNRQRLSAELADVGIALLLLSDRTGIDLIDAIHAKIMVNARNYPVAKSRGRPRRPARSRSRRPRTR